MTMTVETSIPFQVARFHELSLLFREMLHNYNQMNDGPNFVEGNLALDNNNNRLLDSESESGFDSDSDSESELERDSILFDDMSITLDDEYLDFGDSEFSDNETIG